MVFFIMVPMIKRKVLRHLFLCLLNISNFMLVDLIRYSVNQGEDIFTQLLFGVRYLDIRVSYFNDTPEKFWLVHDFIKMNPLYEAIHAVKRFLRMTKELVILDFHRFPFGFVDKKANGDRHKELVDYVKSELGEFMAPDWLGSRASMKDFWELNRTLIVTYEVSCIDKSFKTDDE